MRYRRYGKFKFLDYLTGWLIAIFMLLIAIVGIIFNTPIVPVLCFLFCAFGKILAIILPHREMFLINRNILTVKKGKREREIIIPSNLIVVASCADFCTPLAKKTSIMNRAYFLKDRFAVSLLQEISLEETLKKLHGKYVYRYTNSSIEDGFKHNFVYSFVCDQFILNQLLVDRKCTLIVPESISNKISVHEPKVTVYMDNGY